MKVQKTVEQSGNTVTKFGVAQLNNPTPMWVTWAFRIEFLINKAIGIWLASQNGLDMESVQSIVLWTTIADGFVWGLGRFVGISKETIES